MPFLKWRLVLKYNGGTAYQSNMKLSATLKLTKQTDMCNLQKIRPFIRINELLMKRDLKN